MATTTFFAFQFSQNLPSSPKCLTKKFAKLLNRHRAMINQSDLIYRELPLESGFWLMYVCFQKLRFGPCFVLFQLLFCVLR